MGRRYEKRRQFRQLEVSKVNTAIEVQQKTGERASAASKGMAVFNPFKAFKCSIGQGRQNKKIEALKTRGSRASAGTRLVGGEWF